MPTGSTAPLSGLRVLVSGAGVAGPALAYWLARGGADTTVVELAPALRTSGFAVDFRGPTHFGVLRSMGVLDELRALQTYGGAIQLVDADDHEIYALPAEFAGGDLEVLRSDLSRVLYKRAAERVDYVFGDEITAIEERSDGVDVELAHAPSRTVDLVVGADGLHSGVRALVHGSEAAFVNHLGYYVAGWEFPNDIGLDASTRQYNEPGRMISLSADRERPDRASAFTIFAGPPFDRDWRDVEGQRRYVADALAGLGWHAPAAIAGLRDAPDLYFDTISRVSVPQWTTARTALLGDAAWGVTLGGMGIGTGVVGAYVLAGELAAAGGDPTAALPAYEQRMRASTRGWQKHANAGGFLAPATPFRLWLRDTLLRRRFVRRMMLASTRSFATEAALPAYPL